ncbi:MAG: hypothetical protein HC923_05140 [Myxococcales bacterium]|nr:hypothetical protein [Myxococcales bacterium]
MSYDEGWRLMPRPRAPREHPLGVPGARFALHEAAYVFDHLEGRGWIVHRDTARAEELSRELESLTTPRTVEGRSPSLAPAVAKEEHERRIRVAKTAILDGEIYQVNLTYPRVGAIAGTRAPPSRD